MSHSLAQELTMITEYTDIDAATEQVYLMQARVAQGEDAEQVLEEYGVTPNARWINELTGEED